MKNKIIFSFFIVLMAVVVKGDVSFGAFIIVDELQNNQGICTFAGGRFTGGGWTPSGSTDGIQCDLGRIIKEGGAQLWITNFNPPIQSNSEKHHVFAARSSTVSEGVDMWRWRSGINYGGGVEGSMKILNAIAGVPQTEMRVLESQVYNLSNTYRLKTLWKQDGTTEYYFNNQRIFNDKFSRALNIRYFYLARDGYHSYPTMPGPVYLKIAVWEGGEPSNLESLSEGTSDISASSCHTYTNTSSVPAGFGASWNTLTSAKEMLMKANCADTSTAFETGNGNQITYIYKNGYVYKDNKWNPITYTGTPVTGSDVWLKGTANYTLSNSPTSGYFAAYVCQYINSVWKCGCRDSACVTPYWQLQRWGR